MGLGIGAAVAGWIGTTAASGAVSIMGSTMLAGVVAGAVDAAIVGAVVGGLTSAVTGGDILQGVLVGAIGGAVTGGIMGGINPASFGVGGELGGSLKSFTATEGFKAAGADSAGGSLVKSVGIEPIVSKGTGGVLSKGLQETATGVGKSAIGEMLASGVVEGVKGMAAADAQESAIEMQREEARLQREHDMKKLEMQLAAGSAEASAAPKSQQLASTIAKIEADRNLQREAWQREDTAAARRAATAKSIGRAGVLNRPTLSERDVQVLTADAKGIEPLELTDPTEAALAAQRAV